MKRKLQQQQGINDKVRGIIKCNPSNQQLVEIKSTNKKSIKISVEFLEKIWSQKTDKSSLFLIVIKRNAKEVFLLNCVLQLDKRELQ